MNNDFTIDESIDNSYHDYETEMNEEPSDSDYEKFLDSSFLEE